MASKVLNKWIDYLSNNKQLTKDGITIKFNNYNGPTPYNLSLSHGLSGLIVITIDALYTIGKEDFSITKKILYEFGEFLVRLIKFDRQNISCTPSFYHPYGSNHISRLSWCYGDLGVALALYKLGGYLNSEQFTKTAQKIVIHSSNRVRSEDTLIRDRCVCHGSCGIYSFFNFFNSHLFNGELSKTVKFWHDVTYKDVFKQPDSFMEKLAYYDNINNSYVLKYGILEGLAGMCLALLDESKSLNKLIFIQ